MKPMIFSRKQIDRDLRKSTRRGEKKSKKPNFTPSLPKSTVPFLELFQTEDNPESHAVRNRLSELGLDFIAHSASPKETLKHEQLIQVGGKSQIPFLLDRRSGVKLYGGSVILAYLDNEYEGPKPNRVLRVVRRLNTQIQGRSSRLVWAVRQPIEKLENLRKEVSETWETLRGSVRILRSVIRESSPRESQPNLKSESKKAA